MDRLTAGFASAAVAFADGRGAIVNTVADTFTELANVARGTINKVNPAAGREHRRRGLSGARALDGQRGVGTYTFPVTKLPVPF